MVYCRLHDISKDSFSDILISWGISKLNKIETQEMFGLLRDHSKYSDPLHPQSVTKFVSNLKSKNYVHVAFNFEEGPPNSFFIWKFQSLYNRKISFILKLGFDRNNHNHFLDIRPSPTNLNFDFSDMLMLFKFERPENERKIMLQTKNQTMLGMYCGTAVYLNFT